jgi:hypothetical protein
MQRELMEKFYELDSIKKQKKKDELDSTHAKEVDSSK